MRRNVAVCAILLAMGLGARTYFLTVKDGRICSALIGASSPEQIRENAAGIMKHTFTDEEIRKIDQISCGASA